MRLLILSLSIVGLACASPSSSAPLAAPRSDLTGIWRVAVTAEAPQRQTTTGILALFPSPLLAKRFGFELVEGVTHGTYDIDFQPLGFEVAGGAYLQAATSTLRGNSVEVVLNPFVGHGRLLMSGVLEPNGRVSGSWRYDGLGGGRGSFSLEPAR